MEERPAAERNVVESLLQHAHTAAAVFKGGTGSAPSGGFYYVLEGLTRSVWSLYVRPTGTVVSINLGSIQTDSKPRALAALAALREVPAVGQSLPADEEDALRRYPEIPVGALPPEQAQSLLSAAKTATQ